MIPRVPPVGMEYRILSFYRHPKRDRKVMVVGVSQDGIEVPREFYWERSGYIQRGRELSTEELVTEVRQLLGVPDDYPPLAVPE